MAIIFFSLVGAFWRRMLGGWLGLRRSLIVPCSALALVPCFLTDWRYALVAWCVSMLYFCGKGHEWDKGLTPLLERYAVPVAILAFCLQIFMDYNFHIMTVAGILIALAYWICAKKPEDCKKYGSFIDGKIAYAELIAGALWFGSLNYCFLKEFNL